jgi:hypothetical protein
MLPGPVQVCGIVIENRGSVHNRQRQLPLEIQASDDGDNWWTFHTEREAQDTFRINLAKSAPRARYVRVQRVPGDKDEVFHLSKILIYGKKLY